MAFVPARRLYAVGVSSRLIRHGKRSQFSIRMNTLLLGKCNHSFLVAVTMTTLTHSRSILLNKFISQLCYSIMTGRSGLPREVWKWLLSLDLPIPGAKIGPYQIKNQIDPFIQSPVVDVTCKMGRTVHIYCVITVDWQTREK